MIASLAAGLDRARFKPIVGLFRSGWIKGECEQRDVETHVLPAGGPLHGAWMQACWKLVREKRVQLIHAHEFDANVQGALVAKLSGVPMVATVHGKHYYWMKIRRRLAYRLVSRWGQMVAVSHELKDFIADKVGIDPKRLRVVHNGVSIPVEVSREDTAVCRRLLGILPDERVLGVVGSLYAVKGHRFLLEAFASILKRHPKTTLLVVGRGDLDMALKAQAAELKIDHKVQFLGLRDDVPRLLAIMDIFVMSSLSEGLSMAIIEAMMAGKPVVATRVGGNPELIEHGKTGILVDSESSSSLASGLEQLLLQPRLALGMGARAYQRARAEFSVGEMVRSYQALYDELLPDSTPR
ncbi:MAG: glycosyltransferase family 4 protein [Nitrospiraceae bacterium]|nr:glycosyltransferase family 4 protein [Nitrospiraceae bacterium]